MKTKKNLAEKENKMVKSNLNYREEVKSGEYRTKMSEAFIYIVSGENGKYYNGYRSSTEELIEVLDEIRSPYKLVRFFRVPDEISEQAFEASCEFINGRLSLEDLEKRVDSLRK